MAALTEAQLRSFLNDPAGATQVLSAADYTNITTLETSPYRQLALASRTIAARYATKVALSAGDVRIANNQKFQHYSHLAKIYDARAQGGGGIAGMLTPVVTGVSVSDMALILADTDVPSPMFTSDMGMESYTLGVDLEGYDG